MGALKHHAQMDLFPELTVAYRAEQFKKIRKELQEVQQQDAHVQLKTVHYTNKPVGLKNLFIVHDPLDDELSAALRGQIA